MNIPLRRLPKSVVTGGASMKIVLLVFALAFAANVSANEESVVRGTLSWNDNGVAVITECETGVAYELGTMASGAYAELTRRAEALSKDGVVVASVRGIVEVSYKSVITSPVVLDLSVGGCHDSGA